MKKKDRLSLPGCALLPLWPFVELKAHTQYLQTPLAELSPRLDPTVSLSASKSASESEVNG
jgi:hypothetical protein